MNIQNILWLVSPRWLIFPTVGHIKWDFSLASSTHSAVSILTSKCANELPKSSKVHRYLNNLLSDLEKTLGRNAGRFWTTLCLVEASGEVGRWAKMKIFCLQKELPLHFFCSHSRQWQPRGYKNTTPTNSALRFCSPLDAQTPPVGLQVWYKNPWLEVHFLCVLSKDSFTIANTSMGTFFF